MIDASYLNSVTDLTNYSWPLERVQMIMTWINGKVFSVSDLSCAYHQVPLRPETQTLTSFIIARKTIHVHAWILWVVRTSKFLEPFNDDPFRSAHQEKASNHLH